MDDVEKNVVNNNEEKDSIIQKLMDEAYKLYSNNLRYEEFLDVINKDLTKNHFFAVIVGNMNYQVENGGWSQWYDNEYGCTIEDLINFFKQKEFKDIEEIKSLLLILDDVLNEIEWFEDGKKEIQHVN